ncbi:hypothetical protein BS78_07G134900 [Paspalum vaginatum]|nr:hypothetical protein BS78_07G134900 [Paspalum vaginatum]
MSGTRRIGQHRIQRPNMGEDNVLLHSPAELPVDVTTDSKPPPPSSTPATTLSISTPPPDAVLTTPAAASTLPVVALTRCSTPHLYQCRRRSSGCHGTLSVAFTFLYFGSVT